MIKHQQIIYEPLRSKVLHISREKMPTKIHCKMRHNRVFTFCLFSSSEREGYPPFRDYYSMLLLNKGGFICNIRVLTIFESSIACVQTSCTRKQKTSALNTKANPPQYTLFAPLSNRVYYGGFENREQVVFMQSRETQITMVK